MSVIMTMWVQGDPKKLEQFMESNPDEGRAILESAKEHGLIAHRFYGNSEGGQVMVIDEWPDPQSFQQFFEANQSRIQSMMQAVGAQGQPGVNFWNELDTSDKYGWEHRG